MTLTVLTTIYPQAEPYLADFSASLAAQSDRDFTLYIANDGVADAARHFTACGSRVCLFPAAGTIAQIRQLGLRRVAADGHDAVVFADSDDRFSPERIAVARAGLRTHAVVVNELLPFGDHLASATALLRPLLDPGTTLTWRSVLDDNVLGLSNTAARLAVVQPHAERIAPTITAFDWALFTRALYAGATAVFTDQAVTHYRQHGNNLGLTAERDAAALTRAVTIKAAHYADLAVLDPAFASRAQWFARLANDTTAFSQYAATIAAQPPARGLWWSAARFFKESDHAAL